MYPQTGKAELKQALATAGAQGMDPPRVSRTVILLGLTSLLTDISSEMTASVLPLYLVFELGFSPLSFGVVDGLYQGGATLSRLLGGVLTDRLRLHRDVAAVGYLVSALCKLGLLGAGSSQLGLATVTLVDRLGKGLRTAPRDALIALSSPKRGLAGAFGVHRALDTTGAMLGPVLGFGLLRWIPAGYDAVFVTSFAFGLAGLATLLSFVRNPGPARDDSGSVRIAPAAPLSLLRDRRVALLMLAGGLFGAVTLSDAFIYLLLQHRLGFAKTYLPLLFVVTPGVYLLLAIPFGRLADRIGRDRVVLIGYALLLAVYTVALVGPASTISLALAVLLLGAYYAATDGVLMALTSQALSPELQASGLALVSSANGVGRMVASLAFGLLWSRYEARLGVVAFALGLLVVLAISRWLLALCRAKTAHA
jgi:predicted MFS family arabinose efflux permease